MRRIFPFIKKYWRLYLAALVLVFILANTNLALPDYMSRIVNVGVQQNGIQSPLPDVMRPETMQKLALFQNEEEQANLQAAYRLVDPTVATDPAYPAGGSGPLWLLNSPEPAARSILEQAITKPLVIVQGITMLKENPEQAAQVLGPDFQERLAALPPDLDLFAALEKMPAEVRSTMLSKAGEQLDLLEGTMLNQLAIRAVSMEYQQIGIDIQSKQTNYILRTGAVMLLLALLTVVTSLSVSFLAARSSAGIARDLRSAIFDKVGRFSTAEFNTFSTASLITRSTNDIAQVQQMMYILVRMALMAPLIAAGGIVRALSKSPNMWWLIALAVVLIVIIIAITFTIVVPKFKIVQSLVDRLNLVMRENLSGMLVVRAFNKESYEEKRFDKANKELTSTGLFIGRVMVAHFPLMNLVMTGLNVFIIYVGAREIAASTLRVGDMMAFMQYSMHIMFSFINLSLLFIMIPRSAVSAERIADVLETPIQIQDPAEPQNIPQPTQGKLEFRDVDFRYPGAEEDALHDISFTAEPGKTTAIIGSTGSGKSTLVQLIPRFFEVDKGAILLDGVDIRDLTQEDLRQQIGYVPQRALLFSGTVNTNLKVGKPDASEEEMRQALETAQAANFVFASPEGLETEIAQAGANLSGGQKQRLSIARALIRKPPVYIFDDSFSALDFKTDAALRRALKKTVKDSTIIVVTQRAATAKNSDQILVLDDGRLVGRGTHSELMEKCQTYREIAQSQLSQEELA